MNTGPIVPMAQLLFRFLFAYKKVKSKKKNLLAAEYYPSAVYSQSDSLCICLEIYYLAVFKMQE